MRSRINPDLAKTLNISTIRQYSTIRYDRKLNKEIDDTLRRYNNKIDRLAKQGGYLLPQKVTRDELMEIAWTRRDLQRRLNNLKKFNKRGAEKVILSKGGYAISKYEFEYLKNERARVKRKITKELKYYEETKPKLWGVEKPRTFAQMGDTAYTNLLARYKAVNKNLENLALDELIDYRKLLASVGKDKDYLAENFKLNYLEIMTDVGYYVGYDNEKLEKIKRKILELDPRKFYELYMNEKSIKDVAEYYYVTVDGKRDPRNFKQDVSNLYDNIIENIDVILKDYR